MGKKELMTREREIPIRNIKREKRKKYEKIEGERERMNEKKTERMR